MYRIYKAEPRPCGEDCPTEDAEMITFINRVRNMLPDSYGRVLTHIPNEGLRSAAQAARARSRGMTKGAADLIIPAAVPFVCEMKRTSGGRLSAEQREYLETAAELGAFACLCYGAGAASRAMDEWLQLIDQRTGKTV